MKKIGLLKNIQRCARGYRDYSNKDLMWIELIKRLKATRMSLDDIKRFADLRHKGDATIDDRVKMLLLPECR